MIKLRDFCICNLDLFLIKFKGLPQKSLNCDNLNVIIDLLNCRLSWRFLLQYGSCINCDAISKCLWNALANPTDACDLVDLPQL